jgi:hypothetical protein
VSKVFSVFINTAAVGDVLHKPHILKCLAVMDTNTRLVCIKQASFFNVPLDYFQNTGFNSVPLWTRGQSDVGNFRSLTFFGKVILSACFQDFEKWDSRRHRLQDCVRCTSGLLERCLRHPFEIKSRPQVFLNFNEFVNICISQGLAFQTGCGLQMRTELGLHLPLMFFFI